MRDGSSPESRIYLENENAAVEGLKCKGGAGVWCGGSEENAERGLGQCLPSQTCFPLAMSVLRREGTRGPHEAWPHNTAQHSQHNKQKLPLAKKIPKDNQLDLVKVPQLSVLPPLAPLGRAMQCRW